MESYVETINSALSKIKRKLSEMFHWQNIKSKNLKKRKLSDTESVENFDAKSSSSSANDDGSSEEATIASNLGNSCDTQEEYDLDSLRYCAGSEMLEIMKSDALSSWERSVFNEALLHFCLEKNIKEALIKNQALLHSLWQKLHTGHWSEVPIILRAAFSWGSIILVGFLLKQLQDEVKETSALSKLMQMKSSKIVLVCDRGLMMGKPLKENPLHSVATLFNKFAMVDDALLIDETPPSQCPSDYKPEEATPFSKMMPIESQRLPSLQEFLLNYMEKQMPLKIHGIADEWPALQKWNFKYFCQVAGARTVPIEIGLRYSDSDWSQILMTINQYMNTCIRSQDKHEQRAYLAQHQLFDQIPELLSDIVIPDYCHMGEGDPVMNAWIGPKGTVTPLHHDPDHNILVQIYGYKIILISPKSNSEFIYPFDDVLLNNTSKVNLEEVAQRGDIFEVWPLLKNLQGHYLTLGPGDALYIPPKWWHYVRSLSNSISVSFWWR